MSVGFPAERCWKCNDNNQGCTSFPKILKPPENSMCQRGDLKHFSYWEQKFSCHTVLAPRTYAPLMMIVIIIIIIIISFIQGIYTYIPETNHVPREYSISAILSLLFMVSISLVPALALFYFYVSTYYYYHHHHHLLYAGYLYIYSWDKPCP